jgi:hypothetical protein
MSLEREEGAGRLGWESLLSCNPNFNAPPIWTRLMNTFDEVILSFVSNTQRSTLFLWFVSTRRSPTPSGSMPS